MGDEEQGAGVEGGVGGSECGGKAAEAAVHRYPSGHGVIVEDVE